MTASVSHIGWFDGFQIPERANLNLPSQLLFPDWQLGRFPRDHHYVELYMGRIGALVDYGTCSFRPFPTYCTRHAVSFCSGSPLHPVLCVSLFKATPPQLRRH
jgi:hypothetical protein